MILSCFLNEREGLSTVMKHSTSILRRCQELSYELNTAEQLLFKRRETRAWQRCGLEVHWKFLNEEIGTENLPMLASELCPVAPWSFLQ